MAPRMLVALLAVLAALMIERLLRLLDFITGHGSDIGPIMSLMLNLLPHYMGLALPAAFCVGILSALSVLSRENEIDALEGAGWSVRRVGAPFIGCAVLFAFVSILLFGVAQPYSRYAFNEVKHVIQTAGWDGRIEQGVFLDVREGLVLSASEVDASGRQLFDVFLVQQDAQRETVITAERGIVQTAPEERAVYLVLLNGEVTPSDGGLLQFERLLLDHRFDMEDNPFRPRGGHERELTMFELWDEMYPPPGFPVAEPRFAVEFHNRLIRAVSLIGVALLAVPLGVVRKRGTNWLRIAVAIAVLAAYDNLIKFASGYAKLGHADAALALWGVCALFMAFGSWLYLTTPSQGSETPMRSLLRSYERLRPPKAGPQS